jgi:hypothetical protein
VKRWIRISIKGMRIRNLLKMSPALRVDNEKEYGCCGLYWSLEVLCGGLKPAISKKLSLLVVYYS